MDKYHAELHSRQRRVRAGREARRAAGVYDALPTVPELFRHKDVFITGASGFLGRVLVEKLLRSCPDVGTLYLLLRPKKGVAPVDRVHAIVDVPLFDQLRREQPAALSKLVAVAGDCSELGLGLAAQDRALLQERVSIVFHGAASVRFDDPFQKAVMLNTRGTRELVELSRGMKKLEALVHVSTAFTNINQSPVGERLYPTDVDWRMAIQAASDPSIADVLDNLGHKFLGFHPNTYTYTKALSEQIVGTATALPIIIVRPSIVVGAAEEPLPGWLDTVNSPAALWMAVNKGVVRVNELHGEDYLQDYVPVDLVAKATILAAWARATKQDLDVGGDGDGADAVPVVNVAIADVHPVSPALMSRIYKERTRTDAPYSNAIRYPLLLEPSCRWEHRVYVFFYHILFGVLMDLVLRLSDQKPRLMKVYRKIEVVTLALKAFAKRRFFFDTRKFWTLQMVMHPDDEAAFGYGIERFDPMEDGGRQCIGILQYALKEKFDREEGLRHINRLFWLEMAFYAFLVAISFYLLKPVSYLW